MTQADNTRYSAVVGAALAESARDIVVLLKPSGNIVFANAAAREAYGYSADEFDGMHVAQLRAEQAREGLEQQLASAIQEGILFETDHVRKDGTIFPVEVNSRQVDVAGEPFVLSVVRDISRRRRREIENSQLLTEIEMANQQLEGLLRIVSSAVGQVDLDGLLAEVLDTLRDVMRADLVFLMVLEGPRWCLKAQSGYEDDQQAREFTMAAEEGFASEVARAGEALWVPDVTLLPSTIAVHERLKLRAVLGVPLRVEGATYGVLECCWQDERLVSDAERVMLQVAADRIMAAIVGAERFASTERARHLEASLAAATGELTDSHQIESVLPHALAIMGEALACEIATFGPVAAGIYDVKIAMGMPLRSVLMTGHSSGEPPHDVVDLTLDQGVASAAVIEALGLAEGLAAPVIARGGWSGAVVFGRAQAHGGFSAVEIDAVKRFAAAVAAAFSTSRDYESEHRIAEALQEALLRVDRAVAGMRLSHLYRSATLATRVGGDFYDAFELPDGRVAVLVGDVSGKGLDAAVLTTFVKHTIRAFTHADSSPASVLAKTNDVLAAAARLPEFVSILLLVADPASAEVVYCCAGHPPALVVRTDGTIEAPGCGSPVAGAFAGLDYEEDSFFLEPGDFVVLYTDGVTEARAADGGFFGDERLRTSVLELRTDGLEAVPEALFARVMDYTDGRLSDDIAILTFEIS